MDLNKVVADLSFDNAIIHRIDANCKMQSVSNANNKEFGIDIRYSNPIIIDERKIGKLLLQVDLSIKNEEGEDEEDTISLVLEGAFSCDKNVEDDRFLELLNINGGAALYSIARAKIECISSMIYSEGKIILPMINMVQYFQEKAQNNNEE